MRPFQRRLGFLAGVGLTFSACGAQDPGGQPTGSGGGSGGAGVVHCQIIYLGAVEDDVCAHKYCCAEIDACAVIPNCLTCAESGWAPGDPLCDITPQVSPHKAAVALRNCVDQYCGPDGGR
jgi:hypothetical protein